MILRARPRNTADASGSAPGSTTDSTSPPASKKAPTAGIIGISILLVGLLINGYLAVVAHALSPSEYLSFSAFWSLALIVGFGVFLPIEQEIARRLHGKGNQSQIIRLGVKIALLLAVGELFVLLLISSFLLDSLGHRAANLCAIFALTGTSAVQFIVRGILIGLERLRTYAVIMLIDSGLRFVLAYLLFFADSHTSPAYVWTTVAGIAGAHLPMLVVLVRQTNRAENVVEANSLSSTHKDPQTDEVPATRSMLKAVAPLLVGSLAAQALLNGLPVLVAATASASERVVAGQFQAGFQLARIPLFVAVPLQTMILPMLSRLHQSGRANAAIALARLVAIIVTAAVLGMGIAATIGPELVSLIFGGAYRVPAFDLVLLAAGVAGYLGMLVATQALVVANRHTAVAASWLCGLGVAALVYALTSEVVRGAELGFLTGALTGFVAALVVLAAHIRSD